MANEEQAEKYLNYVNSNYDAFKKKWMKHIYDRQMTWDDDVFSDTIVKVYDYIIKHRYKG